MNKLAEKAQRSCGSALLGMALRNGSAGAIHDPCYAQGTWNTSLPGVLSAIWPDRDTGYLKLKDQGARKTLHLAAPTQLKCGRERDRRDSFPKPHDRIT